MGRTGSTTPSPRPRSTRGRKTRTWCFERDLFGPAPTRIAAPAEGVWQLLRSARPLTAAQVAQEVHSGLVRAGSGDRFFPSSRLCSACGTVREKLALNARTWTCVCGVAHGRDVNAAINIRAAGLAASAGPRCPLVRGLRSVSPHHSRTCCKCGTRHIGRHGGPQSERSGQRKAAARRSSCKRSPHAGGSGFS